MNLELDEWQKKVLETGGNIALRSGRQVGKSTIIAVKAGEFAKSNEKKSIMIISATERQAFLLFSKVLNYLVDNYRPWVKTGKDRPTKTEIKLKNGSIIRCLPTGLDGIGIRGYTVDMLIADEAHFIPEDVWTALTPMLATTKGNIILLSTPHGREGYFYRCFQDSSFTKFHVSSEDCPRIDKDFLKKEKERMSKLQYTQEYLGEFIDELRQLFKDELIKKCMLAKRQESGRGTFYLGVDVARMGGDETTFEILRRDGEMLVQIENIIRTMTLTTDSVNETLELNKKYNFKRIYIDTTGLGVAVFDPLLMHPDTKRKVESIDNSKRSIEYKWEKERQTRLMKEDLYMNLLALMEQGKIKLLDDDTIFQSLKSVQYEYADNGQMKIFGSYTHVCEGLIRAAWCVKDKSLNLNLIYR